MIVLEGQGQQGQTPNQTGQVTAEVKALVLQVKKVFCLHYYYFQNMYIAFLDLICT